MLLTTGNKPTQPYYIQAKPDLNLNPMRSSWIWLGFDVTGRNWGRAQPKTGSKHTRTGNWAGKAH